MGFLSSYEQDYCIGIHQNLEYSLQSKFDAENLATKQMEKAWGIYLADVLIIYVILFLFHEEFKSNKKISKCMTSSYQYFFSEVKDVLKLYDKYNFEGKNVVNALKESAYKQLIQGRQSNIVFDFESNLPSDLLKIRLNYLNQCSPTVLREFIDSVVFRINF